MNKKSISIKIGAEAGQGVKSVGLMLAKLAARSGYHVYTSVEYPSLIRGGHNVMQIIASTEEVTAPKKISDLLIALNQDTVNKHQAELVTENGLLFESSGKIITANVPQGVNLFGVPFLELAEKAVTDKVSVNKDLLINTVALGAVVGLLSGSLEIISALITEEFGNKGEAIVKSNVSAAQSGFNYVVENYSNHIKQSLKPLDTLSSFVPYMVANGNETVALGAISAGLQFAAIYPMSPISNILHVLAQHQESFGYIYKQPEDEISAITMAIGASYAGARSMTATSGGGFCLMTEAYGLAGMTETPLVIIEGMRPGPATGLPTWTDQGDLQMILNAHQGDFPRIVLAASDAKDAFVLTLQAFNLADKYQTPVVLIIDKNICENDQSLPLLEIRDYKVDRGKLTTAIIPNYQRYEYTESGISPRSTPGSGNFFCANSDEHDTTGYSSEDADTRIKMMEKRFKKLEHCKQQDMQAPQLFGPNTAAITIISWGSNKGSILEALKELEDVNYVHITWMSPFPTEALKAMISGSSYILNIECNYTAHLARLIQENTDILINESLLKYDGRQLYPEEVIERVKAIQEKLGPKEKRKK